MKRAVRLSVISILIALILTIIPIGFLNANSGNLVTNGDFNSGNLNGWTIQGSGGNSYAIDVYNDEDNNVARLSLIMDIPERVTYNASMLQRELPVPTTNLTFSCKIKPVNFSNYGNIWVEIYLCTGSDGARHVVGNFFKGYHPGDLPIGSWTTVTANLSSYPYFDSVDIQAWFDGAPGSVSYFDDFVLVENTETAPKPVIGPNNPLTPEEILLLELSIGQQADLYGKTTTGFVKALYDNILGRVPDESGLNDWVTALDNGMSPSQAVYNLVFSDELKSKISPMGFEEFVNFLYKNVFDREPDSGGYVNWVNKLKSGMSKEEILLNFLNSYEFKDICAMFGLTANEDISGEDIIGVFYLNDQNDVCGFGHSAMILKKANNSGIYYSFEPKDPTWYEKADIFDGLDFEGNVTTIDLAQDQMNNLMIGGSGALTGHKYTRSIYISVTKKEGGYMFNEAQKNYTKAYNLYNNNCNHFVQQILSKANLNFTATEGYQASEWIQLAQKITRTSWGKDIGTILIELAIKNSDLDRFGTIPNGAYEAGVSQWSAYNGYIKAP